MSLLLYCITESEAAVKVAHHGVCGETVTGLVESGIRCFVSDFSSAGNSANDAKETAPAFNRVLQEILQQTTVIPFRFPTVLANTADVVIFLRENAAEYLRSLSRLRDMVQMEIRISDSPGDSAERDAKPSGAEYMRQKQDRHHKLKLAAEEVTARLEQSMREVRQRSTASGTRVYALVPRTGVESFLAQAALLKIPSGLSARVTGPWPATEFLKES